MKSISRLRTPQPRTLFGHSARPDRARHLTFSPRERPKRLSRLLRACKTMQNPLVQGENAPALWLGAIKMSFRGLSPSKSRPSRSSVFA